MTCVHGEKGTKYYSFYVLNCEKKRCDSGAVGPEAVERAVGSARVVDAMKPNPCSIHEMHSLHLAVATLLLARLQLTRRNSKKNTVIRNDFSCLPSVSKAP